MEQLVGAAEIAERLRTAGHSVQPRTIHQWRHRHPDFPAPVVSLKQAFVWHWPDVEEWARRTGRLNR